MGVNGSAQLMRWFKHSDEDCVLNPCCVDGVPHVERGNSTIAAPPGGANESAGHAKRQQI